MKAIFPRMRKKLLVLLPILLLAAGASAGWQWWHVWRFQ